MTENNRIPRVFVASPLRGDILRNQAYARLALKDSLSRGEAPFVPHLLYDQVLDDTVDEQRAQAINAALGFLGGCDVLAVYTDLGVSMGMRGEIERAKELGLTVELRRVPKHTVQIHACSTCGYEYEGELPAGAKCPNRHGELTARDQIVPLFMFLGPAARRRVVALDDIEPNRLSPAAWARINDYSRAVYEGGDVRTAVQRVDEAACSWAYYDYTGEKPERVYSEALSPGETPHERDERLRAEAGR